MSRTFLELRQNPSEDDVVAMSLILAEDLEKDFANMELLDIKEAFRQGIRNTDDFLIGPKIWYKWLKKHQQLIWNNEKVEIHMQDKRLAYRTRNGTGMKKISVIDKKLLK